MSRTWFRVSPGGRPPGTPPRTGGLSAPPCPPDSPQALLTIDALGRKCPIPIIMLAERIGDVRVGQIVEVLADDPAAKTDLPAWCALKSQEFVQASTLPAGWSFLVRRSY